MSPVQSLQAKPVFTICCITGKSPEREVLIQYILT